jgi:MoaA/NifB/PqqE/SkfB family radical SAM enzyme/glycosyltransferase involved in cell wall biosynthesis
MVSIVIPTYNAASTIGKLLDSIVNAAGFDECEVVVVDDASTDDTADIVTGYPVRLIKNKTNCGSAKARNTGVKESAGDTIIFFDSDVVLQEDTLVELLSRFKDVQGERGENALIGVYSENSVNAGFIPEFKALQDHSHWLVVKEEEVTAFEPRCSIVRKDTFLRLGGFDENIRGADVEDFEFGYRLSREGRILVDKSILVDHHFPSRFSDLAGNFFNRGASWLQLFMKRGRFDNVITTKNTGLSCMFASMSLLFLAGMFLSKAFALPLVISLFLYFYLYRSFFLLAFRKKGFSFGVKALLLQYVLSQVLILAAAKGLFLFFAGGTGPLPLQKTSAMRGLERIGRLWSSYFSGEPAYLVFFVTSRCNAKCKICFYWQNMEQRPERGLSLEEIDRISRSFKNLVQFTVSGGEPFLRDDIPDIVKCFYENSGARLITIPTNAFFPDRIEEAVARILEECPGCLLNVGLSLDGIGEKHDMMRQLPGSFDRLMQTYKRLQELRRNHSNFYIKITTVLSKYNQHDIEELFDFVKEKLVIDDHEILLARGNTREQYAGDVPFSRYSELVEKVKEHAARNVKKRSYQFSRVFYGLYRHMNEVISKTVLEDRMVYPCLAGRRLVEIYDDGTVVPCEILSTLNPGIPSSMGNIRDFDYDINKVISSPAAEEILSYIEQTKCHCSFECAALTNIVFSPRAYPHLVRCMLT